MPGPVPEQDFVRASQLYGRFARRVNDRGEEFFPGEVSWSENDLAQAIAAQPGGRAWYELDPEALARPEVAEKLPYAQETEPLPGGGLRVRVYAAVTHTYGGVEIDTRARAADGVWVAGVDAGRISNGGYSSGLAQALVLGLVAAEDAGLSVPAPQCQALVAVELEEPLVADAEVVRDLVEHHPPHLPHELVARVQPLERPAVDGDLVRRHRRVRARAHGQRDALVEAEQRQSGRRLVFDDDSDVRHERAQVVRQRLDRLLDQLLELVHRYSLAYGTRLQGDQTLEERPAAQEERAREEARRRLAAAAEEVASAGMHVRAAAVVAG